jgi:NAD(P)-dependent dehydrogenase (short-subunit alcohol dehydrogenase family)
VAPAFDLRDRTVLVTGATDGLGRALAHELAAAGATVLVHGRDRDRERIRATEAEIAAIGGAGAVRTYEADLASLEQMRRMSAEIRWRSTSTTSCSSTATAGCARTAGTREARADLQAYDPAARRRLAELSARLTG